VASNSIPSKGLYLDWCSHEAAKFAVEHWHYSRSLSSAKNVYIGVWEDAQFTGAVVFGIGAGAATNGKRFGLDRAGDVAELTRVALRIGHKATVSRIVAIAVRMLRKQSPGLRMVISFADPAQGHHGGIYQAGNWVYAGQTKSDVEYQLHGRWMHHRTATSSQSVAGLPSRKIPAKHRYLMPLDAAMREKIEKLRKPYPKRVKMDAVSTPHQSADESDPPAPTYGRIGKKAVLSAG
jgi:hypothetical protein